MSKFRVPLIITFDGAAEIEARNEEEAEQIAMMNIRAGLGDVSTGDHDKILDYDFDLHGYPELKDNESVEEIDYDE